MKINLKNLIGLTLEQAEVIIKSASMKPRLKSKDGQHFIVTMDLRNDRVNLTVVNNLVTKATIG